MSRHVKGFGIGIVLAVVGIGAYVQFGATGSSEGPSVTVYKSPTCACCDKWVAHLRENGFSVDIESKLNVQPVKRHFGVPEGVEACHTARVGDYVVEGHVPAEQVKRLLEETPDVRGLAVPGMPIGSPGMERGTRIEPYEVLSFTPSGETSTFAEYGP